MNKKLVALAVAGAFALPMAAQAQTANVTLYGRLNVDLEFVKGLGAERANSRGHDGPELYESEALLKFLLAD